MIVEPDFENNDNKYDSNSNFKLKGVKGLAHRLRKKVKGVAGGAADVVKEGRKKIFKAVVVVLFALLKILLPVFFVLVMVWYIITTDAHTKLESTVDSAISASSSISAEAKDAYEKHGSLLYLKDSEIKEISNSYLQTLERRNNSLYEEISVKDKIGDNTISKIKYANGFDISNACEFILNAERLNFNRVVWKKYDRKEETITDLKTQTDSETNLKYPENDEDTKGLDYFTSMLRPYLQSYVIPSAMLSGVATKSNIEGIAEFAFQIIDKGYHDIEVLQYTMQIAKRDRTKKHYVTKQYEIALYEKEYSCPTDDDPEATCTDYGYNGHELSDQKDKAKQEYDIAAADNIETVTIHKTYDKKTEKQFVYPIIKADTYKKFMRAEYEQIKYKDEDVENYQNEDNSYVTKTENFVDVSGCEGYKQISGSGWKKAGSNISVSVEAGQYITTQYIWNDKLKERYSEEREYEVDDISEFVNKTDNVVEVEEDESTEEETTSGSRSDLRLKASELFSTKEYNYYKELEGEKDITRVDLINAVPSIYNEYLYSEENYSEYIGFSRAYLSMSYSLLNKYLSLEELSIKMGDINEELLGTTISIGKIIDQNFIWPLGKTGAERVTSCAGIRIDPVTLQPTASGHGAMDVAAPSGYPIVASQSGVVYKMQANGAENIHWSYGNCVVIQHGESKDGQYVYYTLYGHMNSYSGDNGLNLKVGDHVEAGQVIGYVGTTGNSTGNHLHFELIQWKKSDGGWYLSKKRGNVEPLLYLQRDTIPAKIMSQNVAVELGSDWGCPDDLTPDKYGSLATAASATADGSNTGSSYTGGEFVFSQEIVSAISSAGYTSSTFNRTLTSGGEYYKTTTITSNTSGSAYPEITKPSTNAEIDAALDKMSDLELLARTIFGESGANSEEAGVLVGISVLNNVKSSKSVAGVLKKKYTGEKTGNLYYTYNCVGDQQFWKSIPPYAKELALKACAAVKRGEYYINGTNLANVEAFYGKNSIPGENWNISHVRAIVVKNNLPGSYTYTGFYYDSAK